MRAILYLVAICMLSACNRAENNDASKTGGLNAANNTQKNAVNPPHGAPGHNCAIPVGAPMTQATQPPPKPFNLTPINTTQPAPTPQVVVDPNDKSKNPAHGQPGHRCDIPVGAPLNTPAAQNPATAVSTTPPVQSPSVVVNPKDTRKNPAHGQPGHRCDIAVGEPLNTPLRTPPTTVANKSAGAVANVAPGMNPAHGQPGHRCDIAVGAPLNAKAPTPQKPVVADTTKQASN